MAPRPNILIFCVDEMRADHLGCAGNTVVRTPNLDRLAGAGTLFRNAYCNNPICMPARATMFTGLLPRDHGLRMNGQSLRTDIPVLPQILKDAGYRTHAAGKLHLTPWVPGAASPDIARYPECLEYWNKGQITEFPTPYYGFDSVDFVGGHTSYVYGPYIRWLLDRGGRRELLTEKFGKPAPAKAPSGYKMALPEELHYNRFIADSTIRVIRESKEKNRAPFFSWCSFPDPHLPLAPPAPYCDMYDPADVQLPARRKGEIDDLPPIYRQVVEGKIRPNGTRHQELSDAQCREMIALNYGMITHVDAEIGRVMAALRECGLEENTLVLFTSDHGDMMGDHGLLWKAFYTFRGCIRVPFIVKAPGIAGGRPCDALVSQVDLLPSLLDFSGVEEPGAGWEKRKTSFDRGAVTPLSLRPGRSWRGLLDGAVPSIRSSVVIENDEMTTGLHVRSLVTQTHRISIYPGEGEGELFDLANDPDELHNLWHSQPALRDALIRALLDEYSLHTPSYPVPAWNA